MDQRKSGGSRPRFQKEDITGAMEYLARMACQKMKLPDVWVQTIMGTEGGRATAGQLSETDSVEDPPEELVEFFGRPVTHKPGSSLKIATMRIRYTLGISIWNDDDEQEDPVPFSGLMEAESA